MRIEFIGDVRALPLLLLKAFVYDMEVKVLFGLVDNTRLVLFWVSLLEATLFLLFDLVIQL